MSKNGTKAGVFGAAFYCKLHASLQPEKVFWL